MARCRGLTAAGDDVAAEAFEAALAAHAQAPDTFEAARTRLLYGGRLRRTGRRVDAASSYGSPSTPSRPWT